MERITEVAMSGDIIETEETVTILNEDGEQVNINVYTAYTREQ